MELLKIRTEQFEGPLDLLLFLIQKNELDVSGISIRKITDPYLQYCELLKEIDFDGASEFLVMAATLIHIKSKRLLPDEAAEGQPVAADGAPATEEELVQRLLEYKRFQEAGHRIAELPKLNEDFFTRPNVPPPERQTVWRELDLTALTLVFQDALKRARKRTKVVIREPISLPERIAQLSRILQVGELTEFSKILSAEPTRQEIVVTFIALLELARLRKLRIYQNESFGTVYLTLSESLGAFDPSLATGFRYATATNMQEPTTHG